MSHCLDQCRSAYVWTAQRAAAVVVSLLVNGHSVIGNEANKQFMASSEEQRRAAFRIVLAGAGETCTGITRTYFQGETATGHAIWSVDCGGDNAYSISIAPDEGGSTKLIACRVLQQLDGMECFKPLPRHR
jgi:hypothetical protein